MARKRQQYRRRPRPMTTTDNGLDDQALRAAAQELASSRTIADLRVLVEQSHEAAEAADLEAQQNPGPDALRQFRSAERFSAEAVRALALAEAAAQPSSNLDGR